jgi:anti-sigma regulatory factor (Ser/Thr protein kinase)
MFTEVSDSSQVAAARRKVGELAIRIGLPQARIDQLAIVVTELATNLLKHGGGGHIHASHCDDAGGTGLELLALDRGTGMANPARCMQDGYSTAGSPGNGLGSIARLADTLEIYTRSGQGSAVMCRFITRPAPTRHGILGAVSGRTGLWRQLVVERYQARTHDHAGRRFWSWHRGGPCG